MDVAILGPLEVRDDRGQLVNVPGGRQRALLALLAVNAGKVTPAERLIDDLWGPVAPQQPANALQIVVFKLRRALGAERIETRPPGYLLAVGAEEVDAHRFERLVGEGRAALTEGRPEQAVACFDEALRQWRGTALIEVADVQTATAAASRWQELRDTAAEDRFDALLAMGRGAELVPDLDAAIKGAPFRERLRGQLMLALYRSGRQADALRAYRDARHVFAEELGLEPGAELRRLEAAILDHDPSLDVQLTASVSASGVEPAPVTTPTNLRPARTSFVGRERDLAGIGELLEQHRLVTIVGAGGAGKTRLATQFASAEAATYPDGVWLVPFDALLSGDGVAATTAAALGLSTADTSGQPALAATSSLERVCGFLADRTALVVLDNCEHVIDEAAALVEELLAAAPQMRLLATSREALRVPGEMVWPVPPLGTDDAVALFADRARAATPDFELDDTSEAVVADLCMRLDGMPLAIELIAARARAFTVGQLAERLDDRFRLLTGGARTALPRQQTLRAVTDWSYDLLFDDERTVFERLSVFVGGCSLEAAEAVCADEELAPVEVDGLVGRLVDKSLVVADGSGRFRLLLTLAHYGRERLAERDDAVAVRDRHAEYFNRLAALSSGSDRTGHGGRPQEWWLAWLTAELDNVRAALAWSIGRSDGATAQSLAGHLGWYWWWTGRTAEGLAWLRDAVACDESTSPATRGRAIAWMAWFALDVGDPDTAAKVVDEALELTREAEDHASLALAWSVMAQLDRRAGQLEAAAADLDKATHAYLARHDVWGDAMASAVRSRAADLRGDHDAAEREALAAIDVYRAIGDHCTLVLMLERLSQTLQAVGRPEAAEDAAREACAVSDAQGLRGWQCTVRTRLGTLALLQGDTDRAVALHGEAIELARALALPAAEVVALDNLGLVHRRNGDFDAARGCHEAARAIADRIGVALTTMVNCSHLGYLAEQTDDLDAAWRWHDQALGVARQLHDDRGMAMAVEGLAGAAAAKGDGSMAARMLGYAGALRASIGARLQGAERVDIERAEARARELLGDADYNDAAEEGRRAPIEALVGP